MRLNLKRLIPLAVLSGIAMLVVACTQSVNDDRVCIGQKHACDESKTSLNKNANGNQDDTELSVNPGS